MGKVVAGELGGMKRTVGYSHNRKSQANNSLPGLIFLMPSLSGGGAEGVASSLLPYISQYFDVILVLLENRTIRPVPEKVRLKALSGPLERQTAHILRIPYHFFSLARLVQKNHIQIVMSFMEQANIINLLTAFLTNHKAVISQRVEPNRQYASRGLIGKFILKASLMLYPRARRVVAVSEEIRKVLLFEYKLDPERVSVIPNPVDAKKLARQSKASSPSCIPDKFLLHVGRMRLAHKAQDVIIEAFRLLHLKYKDLSLVIIGDGPDRERIRIQIKELGLQDAAIMMGWQDNVACFMARAQVFLLSSRYEGWPNVLVEAMACGCPVVSTDCDTGPREILGDNEYGLLVPVDDYEAMALEVEKLLLDPEMKKKFSERGMERASHFQTEKIAARYITILKNLL
jgi:N-acetylgalactosamine-N,N'-diacetylbacillosaminyl-diphospho-undecaprenol 4-alpha-N-acetylgalactosaminyltransferase